MAPAGLLRALLPEAKGIVVNANEWRHYDWYIFPEFIQKPSLMTHQ